MTIPPPFAAMLLSNLRAAIAVAGLIFCAYTMWRVLQTWKLSGRINVTTWWIVLVTAVISFALLGRWGRIAIVGILLTLLVMLFRLIKQRH